MGNFCQGGFSLQELEQFQAGAAGKGELCLQQEAFPCLRFPLVDSDEESDHADVACARR